MEKKYPKCGFYWVCRRNTTPEIAYCWGLIWTVTGDDKPFRKESFEFIDPTPIEFPSYENISQFPVNELWK